MACTSASSGLGDSGKLLEEVAVSGDWQEWMRFSSNVSEEEVQDWRYNDEEKNKSDQYSGKTGYVQSIAAVNER